MSKQKKLDFFLKNPNTSVITTAEEPTPSTSDVTSSLEPKPKKPKIRKFDPSYLGFGFTYKDDCPQCVICSEILTNSSMAPAKLLRHLETKHQQYKKEDLIMSCMVDANLTLFGDKSAKKIKTIPLSNDTVSNRITMMSDDVHQQLIRKIKRSKLYALQLDESTDITDKALLLIYTRYVDWDEKEIKEKFLNCLELKKHTTGAEIFSALSDCFLSTDLKMSDCISICTDGAANMTGRHPGLVAKMKQVAPNIQSTHCMIHREMLASKRMSAEFNQVLTTAVKTVNFIKSSSLNSRLLAMLCDEMGSAHRTLLLHAEVRWLSRGRILKRLCELREEIIIFLSSKNCDLVQYFKDIDWNMKLCYLADIFQLLNEPNLSLQGTQKTMFHSYSKIEGQKKKI
ncbi:SCAN domain-containing protein 3-like [Metopolophium dirhodum]|uniref:SCAN domain-containing protein 3-like n=1 Tax=Metopolophium dirhodum TaxID=44670 RepID=UPI00298FA20B|nr:SCAN domain-containing protein 3-like [Metopolophium dirhodum]